MRSEEFLDVGHGNGSGFVDAHQVSPGHHLVIFRVHILPGRNDNIRFTLTSKNSSTRASSQATLCDHQCDDGLTSLDIQTRINLIFRKTVSKQVPQLHQTPVWDNTHLDGLVVSIPADLDSHDNIPELLLRRQDHFVLSVFLLTVNSNVSSIFKPYFILQSLILKSNKFNIFFSITVYNINSGESFYGTTGSPHIWVRWVQSWCTRKGSSDFRGLATSHRCSCSCCTEDKLINIKYFNEFA